MFRIMQHWLHMWHFQVEYGSRGEKLLHWFKLYINDLIRTLFRLESVTYDVSKFDHVSPLHVEGTALFLTLIYFILDFSIKMYLPNVIRKMMAFMPIFMLISNFILSFFSSMLMPIMLSDWYFYFSYFVICMPEYISPSLYTHCIRCGCHEYTQGSQQNLENLDIGILSVQVQK